VIISIQSNPIIIRKVAAEELVAIPTRFGCFRTTNVLIQYSTVLAELTKQDVQANKMT
jgi:hypothetical protein